jgi:hypothetical protein
MSGSRFEANGFREDALIPDLNQCLPGKGLEISQEWRDYLSLLLEDQGA